MGKRDNLYQLSGQVELDNASITTFVYEDQKDKAPKRGVGIQKQSKAVVVSESIFVDNPKPGKKTKRVNLIK